MCAMKFRSSFSTGKGSEGKFNRSRLSVERSKIEKSVFAISAGVSSLERLIEDIDAFS